MSIDIQIDPPLRVIHLQGSEVLNRTMLEDLSARLVRTRDYDRSFSIVADFTNVQYLDLDVADLRRLVDRVLLKSRHRGRQAIVTGPDQGRYALGQLFNALCERAEESHQEIFRTVGEAHAWLELPSANVHVLDRV